MELLDNSTAMIHIQRILVVVRNLSSLGFMFVGHVDILYKFDVGLLRAASNCCCARVSLFYLLLLDWRISSLVGDNTV